MKYFNEYRMFVVDPVKELRMWAVNANSAGLFYLVHGAVYAPSVTDFLNVTVIRVFILGLFTISLL
ncbi:hypothetical protein J2T15_003763 [Paenibacillus harenae]|uniref:Uncharacterized protein n=1 Tax=Paenibacillus harenae TaxID=306543 RepID=A0ABT9U5L7_PAEHA|nr:hypothetical protein [Paenibacillus harenae]